MIIHVSCMSDHGVKIEIKYHKEKLLSRVASSSPENSTKIYHHDDYCLL